MDEPKYTGEKDARNEKPIIEYIAIPDSDKEESKNDSFSADMLQALSTLSKEDLSFIILKYQENYSEYELADYFNLTVEEIKQKEIDILELLKNNEDIKLIRKLKKDNI